MKFEKFLKSVGTHGEVIARTESEKWLVCGGVGMVIPRGVDNLLGSPTKAEYASIVDVISKVDLDDPVTLERAILLEPDGKAADIYRCFDTVDGLYEVVICNADYGLLERKDNLGYFEIEIDCDEDGNALPENDVKTIKYLLVFDHKKEIVGFITGAKLDPIARSRRA